MVEPMESSSYTTTTISFHRLYLFHSLLFTSLKGSSLENNSEWNSTSKVNPMMIIIGMIVVCVCVYVLDMNISYRTGNSGRKCKVLTNDSEEDIFLFNLSSILFSILVVTREEATITFVHVTYHK